MPPSDGPVSGPLVDAIEAAVEGGTTIRDLAGLAAVEANRIYRLHQGGRHGLTLDDIDRLCLVLGLTLQDDEPED